MWSGSSVSSDESGACCGVPCAHGSAFPLAPTPQALPWYFDEMTEVEAAAWKRGEHGAKSVHLLRGLTVVDGILRVPEGITIIPSEGLSKRTDFTEVVLPNTLTCIDNGAFLRCTRLATLDLPGALAYIGHNAFTGCSAITALHLPASVDTVGSGAFSDCTALQTVSMESAEVEFEYYEDADKYFSGCTSLAAISVPDPDHAMATWPDGGRGLFDEYNDEEAHLPKLLAAATPDMQLRYYWYPGQDGHALCLPSARRAVLTVLLVAARLMHRQSRRVALTARRTVLPDLPDELWFCILSFIRRHELGGAVYLQHNPRTQSPVTAAPLNPKDIHELEREPEPAATGSGASETDSQVGESTCSETDSDGQHPDALPGPVARCSRCTEMMFCCTCTTVTTNPTTTAEF